MCALLHRWFGDEIALALVDSPMLWDKDLDVCLHDVGMDACSLKRWGLAIVIHATFAVNTHVPRVVYWVCQRSDHGVLGTWMEFHVLF